LYFRNNFEIDFQLLILQSNLNAMIKKFTFTLIIPLLFEIAPLSAQELKFESKFGINVCNMTNTQNTNALIGLNVGLGLEIPLSKTFSMIPEIYISNQGTNLNSTGVSNFSKSNNSLNNRNITFSEVSYRLNYVNIPLLFRANVDLNKARIFATAGPQIGLAYSQRFYAVSGSDKGYGNFANGEWSTTDIAFVIGAGFGADVAKNREIAFDIRYAKGLTSVLGTRYSNSGTSVNMDVISINFYYLIKFGNKKLVGR
jgi:hypothetical protein